MKKVIDETNRRRKIQLEYNKKHKISPSTIKKAIKEGIEIYQEAEQIVAESVGLDTEKLQLQELITQLTYEMEKAARNLQFEKAAFLRDKIKELKDFLKNSNN